MANIRTDILITDREIREVIAGRLSCYALANTKDCDKRTINRILREMKNPEIDKALELAKTKSRFGGKGGTGRPIMRSLLTEDDELDYKQNLITLSGLSHRHGVSPQTIKRWLTESGIEIKQPGAQREERPSSPEDKATPSRPPRPCFAIRLMDSSLISAN